jgi:multidrug transporter EmrE-like cation transporter
MARVILVAAGLSETAFAVFLRLSHGLTQPWPIPASASRARVCASHPGSR